MHNKNKDPDYVYIYAFFYSFWMKKSEFEKNIINI
jgi:hypothetical protein